MKYIFQKKYKILLTAIFALSFLLISQPVKAADLTVIFPDDPTFNELEILPGFTTSKIITVINNAEVEKNVGLIIENNSSAELNDVLYFTVQKNGNIIYGGPTDPKTLSDLVNDGILSLGTLTPGESANFTVSSEFTKNAGNEYQLKTSIFDLKIGFVETSPPPPTNTNIPSNTNNTNGTVLGAETEAEPKIKGKIFGMEVELPLSGSQLLRYSLLIIALFAIIMAVISPIYHKLNLKKKR